MLDKEVTDANVRRGRKVDDSNHRIENTRTNVG